MNESINQYKLASVLTAFFHDTPTYPRVEAPSSFFLGYNYIYFLELNFSQHHDLFNVYNLKFKLLNCHIKFYMKVKRLAKKIYA